MVGDVRRYSDPVPIDTRKIESQLLDIGYLGTGSERQRAAAEELDGPERLSLRRQLPRPVRKMVPTYG